MTADNPIRTAMLHAAIEECMRHNEPVTYENLRTKLPDDFALEADEVPVLKDEPAFRNAGPTLEAEPKTLEAALAEIVALENNLHEARQLFRDCGDEVKRARAVVAEKIQIWQRDGATGPLTADANAREFIRTSIRERAERAAQYRSDGKGLDRYLRATGQPGNAGRVDPRRGGMPRSQAARVNADRARARAAVARPKLPSER